MDTEKNESGGETSNISEQEVVRELCQLVSLVYGVCAICFKISLDQNYLLYIFPPKIFNLFISNQETHCIASTLHSLHSYQQTLQIK